MYCFDFSFSKVSIDLGAMPPTSFKNFKAFAAKPREAKYLARFIFECNEGFVWVLEFEEGSTKASMIELLQIISMYRLFSKVLHVALLPKLPLETDRKNLSRIRVEKTHLQKAFVTLAQEASEKNSKITHH